MTTKYVIYNAQGEILRTGICPADEVQLQVGEGEFLVEADACCVKDSVDPQTGDIIPNGRGPIAPQPVPTPPSNGLSVQTQLDLLWQAMDAGAYPKAEPFYSAVKASKGIQ